MNTIGRLRISRLCGAVAAALCFGLATPAGAWSQPQWVRQFGTPNSDYASGVATDRRGDVYVTSAQGSGLWITKYSSAGTLLWQRQLGLVDYNYIQGVATDGKGDVYIVGSTYGSFGGPNRGREDAWIAKYSVAGALLWNRQLGTPDNDSALSVAIDGKGNAYVAGYTQAYCSSVEITCRTRAWLAKYSAHGEYRWQRELPRGYTDMKFATSVAINPDGDAYVAGYAATEPAWVARYSPAGALLWERQFGSVGNDYYTRGAASDDEGNVYITGTTSGFVGEGGYDAWIAKYSSAGVALWNRQIGTPADDQAVGVATDDEGGVYIAGSTLGALGGPNQGGGDVWITKYSGAGSQLWNRQLGTPADDGAVGVATDDEGGVYIAGSTLGALGGPNQGGSDAFLAKYSQRR